MHDSDTAKSIGIWIRVSHENSVKTDSPEHHEHRARAYAEFKGWHVAEVYRLDAVSGKSVKHLPETRRMLEDVHRGRITGLVFSKLARFARNTKELLEFSDIFRKYEADLISLQESIDTSTPAGRLYFTLIAALGQWEREETSERVKASVPVRAKLGKPTGGQAPFGYQWVNKQLVIDPAEAPIRKLMFNLFKEHRRFRTVARKLNEAGHRTRRGAKFSDTTVRRLLTDPVAKGKRRANYTRSLGDGKRWKLKDESEWVWTEVEPIVSNEVWNEVNDHIKAHRKKRKRKGRPPVHLFAGLTYCQCGKKMYVPSNTPKYVCEACRNKIPIEDMNNVFYAQLKQFIFSPEDVAHYLDQADDALRQKADLLELLENEKAAVKRKMDKVYQLYMDDKISPDQFGTRYSTHEERLKQLDDEIPRLQGEHDFLKIKQMGSGELFNSAKSFYSQWPHLKKKEKRMVIENIVDRIEVAENTVVIDLAFSPNPSSFKELSINPRTHRDSSRPPS